MKNKTVNESLKYLIVGVGALLTDNLSFYLAANWVELSVFFASSIALLCGFIVSFMGNKLFVFQADQSNSSHTIFFQLLMYGCLLVFNIYFTYIFVTFCTEKLNIHIMLAKVTATAIIVIWNFIIYKKVIFKRY